MSQHMRSTNFFGRFCSYPQGNISFFPQLIAGVAVVLSLHWTPFFGGDNQFVCIVKDDWLGRTIECFSLELTITAYWSNASDEDYWGLAIQVATAFGVVAVLAGGVAWVVLLSAVCFSLDRLTLWRIQVSSVFASLFSILTLVGVGINVCHETLIPSDSFRPSCDRKRLHLGDAAMEIMAFVFYLLAVFLVQGYMESARVEIYEEVPHNDEELPTVPPAPAPIAATRAAAPTARADK